jgi:hypothetical protein
MIYYTGVICCRNHFTRVTIYSADVATGGKKENEKSEFHPLQLFKRQSGRETHSTRRFLRLAPTCRLFFVVSSQTTKKEKT